MISQKFCSLPPEGSITQDSLKMFQQIVRTYILIFIYPTKAAVKKTKSKTALQSQVIHDVEESSCLSLVYSAITYTALSSLTDNIMLQAIFGLFIYIHAALLSVLLNSSSTLH